MPDARPILVTGSHRSGTGWVGQVIGASPSPKVAYLWEPFSLLHRPGICDAVFPYWFPYIRNENASKVQGSIADMLAFRYKTGAELREVRTPKDVARLLRDRRGFAHYRRENARPLLKDPVAVFSAEWLCDTFPMDVIVLIRHPAAFSYSIKRYDWTHPFDHFVQQPLLMRDLLAPFDGAIRTAAVSPPPVLDQAILLWNVIHHAIRQFQDRRPDWLFLRLEDIARDPIGGFRKIYERLGLTFDQGVVARIEETSGASNREEATSRSDVRRNSQASVIAWKRCLSSQEIATIRTGVEPLAGEFYSDADW
jgi:hypothetical protein